MSEDALAVKTALAELRTFMKKTHQADVLLAAVDNDEYNFQRLTLSDPLSEQFFQVVLSAVGDADEEYDLRPYQPGYKPESYELCYLSLSDATQVKSVVDSVSKFDDLELFKEADDFIDSLKFYGIIADDGTHQAVFFREFSSKKELTRSPWIPIMLQKDKYDHVKDKIFLFDDGIDCFSWDGYLFIRKVAAFQKIFRYFEALMQHADETIRSIAPRIPISNQDEFAETCKAIPFMLAKLAQIAKQPYLARVTMTDIKRTIKDFSLDVKTVEVSGVEKLVFDASPAKRWLILKLLDDDYLGSTMTALKYESNSKVRI